MLRTAYRVIAVVAAAAYVLGMAGMWAFNPDEAALAESDLLWQAFGIAAYAAFALLVALALGGLLALLVRVLRRALSPSA